ncbi:MAG TPA: LuxR C-terminal-related transcriptional regulator, partial [Mycobacterium sp.]|nr:LuxR C-terminal-related transcriptional regulator [Mycobacterium sp.]
RSRHRDYYTAMAAALDAPAGSDYEQRVEHAEIDIDNLRAAFNWSRENSDIALALALASSLYPLWRARGRPREGLAWFNAALADLDAQHQEVAAAVCARAFADRALFAAHMGAADTLDQAQHALAIAREVDDPALLVRALTACGPIAAISAETARPYLAEAIGLARELDDRWRLGEILAWQALVAVTEGDPVAGGAAAEEGRDLADAIGDRYVSRQCRWCLGVLQLWQGDLVAGVTQLGSVVADAEVAHDMFFKAQSLTGQSHGLAWQGETNAARAAADAAIEAAAQVGDIAVGNAYGALSDAALAAGDVAAARDASTLAWQHHSAIPGAAALTRTYVARATLASGDLVAARRWADDAVTKTRGYFLMLALVTRARVAIAQGEPEQGDRDAHDALAIAAEIEGHLVIPDVLECLGGLAGDAGSHREAARLIGAANAIRQRMGAVRFKVLDESYEASVAALRDALGQKDFDAAWAEGAALSTEEAIAYAQRGRGERRRPASGWASLTPTERDVVRLVSEGLANNDIATRLFVSPRTVQSHLTHVYTKLGLSSRVQLVQEAARHA